MAKYSNTKAKINEKISTNGRQAVTGSILNDVLQTMVDSLGADYQFGGLVQPGSSFTAGEQPVVFLATTPGTYANFGGLVVADGEVALLVWSGSAWSKQNPDIATRTELNQLGQYADNPEWVRVVTDSNDKILYGVKTDGKFYFGDGCPPQVQEYVLTHKAEIEVALAAKVDKVTGKSLIDADYASAQGAKDNPEYLQVTTDSDDKILEGITQDGTKVIGTDLEVGGNTTIGGDAKILGNMEVSGVSYNVVENSEYLDATTDSADKVLSYRDKEGILHENIGIEPKHFNSSDVYYRNQHKEASLLNACRANLGDYACTQDLQLCVVNDSHSDDVAMEHAVEITNRFHTIEGLLHCGDITWTTYTPDYVKHFFDDIMSKCKKPWFITIGNHDAGTTMYVSYGGTHEDMYNSFIKPMVDAGNLAMGEYEVGKSYYFHDFRDRKIRMIVTYDYDTPIASTDDLYESNYWEPITYDASYPQLQENHNYVYGANNPICVNCGTYTYFSFRLKQSVRTTSGQYTQDYDLNNGWTRPAFKIARGSRVIRKDQADWFINTLATTPDGYGVVVVSHIPISPNFQAQKDKKFTSASYKDGYIYGVDGIYPMVNIETDIFCDIVQAFIDRDTLTEHVIMKKEKEGSWEESDATYMNVNTDHQSGEDYAYNISADFSNVPSRCHFISFIGGHHHADIIYRHLTYTKQWAFHGVTLRQQYDAGDQARARFTNTSASDNVNVLSFAKNRLAIVRIGNDETINGRKRDFEVINTNEN